MTISSLIRDKVEYFMTNKKVVIDGEEIYPRAPRDINRGLCEEFMMEVLSEIDGGEERCSEMYDEAKGGHMWIYYDGKHYDAECPSGVLEWKQLPFFK